MATTIESPSSPGGYYVGRLTDDDLAFSQQGEEWRYWSFFFPSLREAGFWGAGATPDEAKAAAYRRAVDLDKAEPSTTVDTMDRDTITDAAMLLAVRIGHEIDAQWSVLVNTPEGRRYVRRRKHGSFEITNA